jgi:outer membrane receptor protein involved in Fe transport
MMGAAILYRGAGLGLVLGLSSVALAQVGPTDALTPKTADTARLDEIVVTGSLIRHTEAAGSKLTVIGRDQIDASGYGSIEDVLATVTQNFNQNNGAVVEGNRFFNLNRGAEVQLRGLGAGTTLTLINGQRQGASGFQGMFTDVSTIPASAIERIEILPEGATALYGSDAIGGVVNIILRRNFNGFETRLRASTAGGDADERGIAQLWGHAWSRGHVLLGFQYDDSAALACSARAYCAANSDFRRFGGSDFRGVGSNPGTIVDPDTLAPIAAIPHGQDGTQLTAAQLIPGAVNHTNSVIHNDILPSQTMRSAFVNTSYRPADNWEISFDGRYSSREFKSTFPQPAGYFTVPANNAFNHLGGPVVVAYDFTADLGPVVDSGPTETSFASAGVKRLLPGGWQASVGANYSRSREEFVEINNFSYFGQDAVNAALDNSDPTVALNIFGDGSYTNAATLRSLGTVYDVVNTFTTTSANVIADGPLFDGTAGASRLAVGGEFRKEHSNGINIADGKENRRREVAAAFFELAAPILAGRRGSNVNRLDLSLAGRYDRYSDVGTTFNPKVGLSWQASRLLRLRGTWGTSFRPPPFFWSNPGQIGDVFTSDVVDPQSPTNFTHALVVAGPMPDLQPETANAWTVGMDVTLPAAPGFSLSLTYFDIDYEGKVQPPGFSGDFLVRENEFASLITRNPTQAQIDVFCQGPLRNGGDCNPPIDAILDIRMRNLGSVKTRGVDVALDYSNDTARGNWVYGLNGTHIFDQKQQIMPTAPVFDHVDTVGNPLQFRFAGHVSWSLQRWTMQATVNYTGRYRDPGSVPARDVDSWTTADFNVGYQVEGGQGWLANTQINFGIINFLDQRPPFVNRFDQFSGTVGYDAANATVLGRQVSLQVVKSWGQ